MIRLMNEYNYKSPISFTKMQTEYNEQLENECMLVIKEKIGIDVNKDELIKALNYDRAQYEKGFRDGLSKAYHQNHGYWAKNDMGYARIYRCSNCDADADDDNNLTSFCPYCGALMERKDG